LLTAAHVGDGTRLLDVATGPGTLAAKAAERGGRVIGIDIAPAMIALARTLHPHLDFREGSAEDLPFAPSSFDSVVSGFGVGHFSKPERVLAEFARVLIPKGRVALSWWDGFGKNRINGIFFEAINELGISAPGALPAGPAVDRFSDPEQFAAILRAAGFEVAGIDYISFSHPLKNIDELWDLALGSFVRVSTVIRAQNADVQQQIRQKVEQVARQYASPGGFQIPIAFRVIAGIR
jgi:SAM-dependent methyltransferase